MMELFRLLFVRLPFGEPPRLVLPFGEPPRLVGLIHLMPKSPPATDAGVRSFTSNTFPSILPSRRFFSSSSMTVCWSRNARCGSRRRVLGSVGFNCLIPQ
jgi:hypothetical protein